jgi:threonine dehydrogenase-like Zn-dependent dehydrogenase
MKALVKEYPTRFVSLFLNIEKPRVEEPDDVLVQVTGRAIRQRKIER